MKKRWKVVLAILALLLVGGAVVFQMSQPLPAEVLKVQRGSIADRFQEQGLVQAKEETPLYAPYPAKVTRVSVKEGATVQKGDLLVTLDTNDLLAQRQVLQAQLRSIQAQKDLQVITIDLETKAALLEAGVISQKEYDEAKNTLSSDYYPALLAGVQAQINQLSRQTSLGRILSPVAGQVTGLEAKVGMTVTPTQPLLSIQSRDPIEIQVFLLARDVALIMLGQEAQVQWAGKKETIRFPAKVVAIAPSALEKVSALGLIEQRLKITLEPQIPANLELKPGYALDVVFTLGEEKDQLVIPKPALFPYQDGQALWVIQDGKAAIRPVKEGIENSTHVAILEGLQEGDLVLLQPKLPGLAEEKKIEAIFAR